MKKRLLVIPILLMVLLIVLSLNVQALDSETNQVEKAYSYLQNQVDGKWDSLSAENNALALLALAHDDRLSYDGKTALLKKASQSRYGTCWPSSSCKVKTTAFALLALNRIGESNEEVLSWIKSRQKAFLASGLLWFLQLDSSSRANCSVSYESGDRTIEDNIQLNKDQTYVLPSSSCFELSSDKYWLRIKTSCLEKSFYVQCDSEDPVYVSLPYKLGNTFYISPNTFSAPSEVSINALCLADGSLCSYEGTLWGAYALMKAGEDYNQLLPYLISESESNKKYLPDALLYLLTSREEHASNLLEKQRREGYWTDIGGKGKYWDSALAYLALKDYSPDALEKTKKWLLKVQNDEGSWGSYKLRDTSMILYSVWPKDVSVAGDECSSIYGYNCRDSCLEGEEEVSYSCLSGICCKPQELECLSIEDCAKDECIGKTVTDYFGVKGVCESPEKSCDDNFDNDYDGLTDSNDPDCQVTCYELLGEECSLDEKCDGTLRKTLETNRCCIGECIKEEKTCYEQGGVFCESYSDCEGEVVASSDSTQEYCCIGSCKKSSAWIWILLILLLLSSAGGYYAYKKGYFKKWIGKLKKKPSAPATGFPSYRPPIRPYYPPQQFRTQRPQHYPPLKKEKAKDELGETLEKLKKFSDKK